MVIQRQSLVLLCLLAVSLSTPPLAQANSSGPKEGWYGFDNSPNKDQDGNLRKRCARSFKRVPNPGNMYRFSSLCESLGMQCKRVCDWEGRSKGCNDNPQNGRPDGSRLAYCGPPTVWRTYTVTSGGSTRGKTWVTATANGKTARVDVIDPGGCAGAYMNAIGQVRVLVQYAGPNRFRVDKKVPLKLRGIGGCGLSAK